MIQLTPEQSQALRGEKGAVRVHDPETDTTYVLVRDEAYGRIWALSEADDDEFVRICILTSWKSLGVKVGMTRMDIYNDLDPRRQP